MTERFKFVGPQPTEPSHEVTYVDQKVATIMRSIMDHDHIREYDVIERHVRDVITSVVDDMY